ncbi:hypothetical protein C7405_10518 [Paraburkholderia caballeronis]|nr:hypothetical protein C7405_10518 [Paraburkholderia caballeronis]
MLKPLRLSYGDVGRRDVSIVGGNMRFDPQQVEPRDIREIRQRARRFERAEKSRKLATITKRSRIVGREPARVFERGGAELFVAR